MHTPSSEMYVYFLIENNMYISCTWWRWDHQAAEVFACQRDAGVLTGLHTESLFSTSLQLHGHTIRNGAGALVGGRLHPHASACTAAAPTAAAPAAPAAVLNRPCLPCPWAPLMLWTPTVLLPLLLLLLLPMLLLLLIMTLSLNRPCPPCPWAPPPARLPS